MTKEKQKYIKRFFLVTQYYKNTHVVENKLLPHFQSQKLAHYVSKQKWDLTDVGMKLIFTPLYS